LIFVFVYAITLEQVEAVWTAEQNSAVQISDNKQLWSTRKQRIQDRHRESVAEQKRL